MTDKDFPVEWDRLERLVQVDAWKQVDAQLSIQQILGITDSQVAELHVVAGEIYSKEDPLLAADAWLFITVLNPFDSDAWLNLGLAEQKTKRYEEALQAFQMSALLHSWRPEPYVGMGECMQAMGDEIGATRCFDQAAEIRPTADPEPELIPQVRDATTLLLATYLVEKGVEIDLEDLAGEDLQEVLSLFFLHFRERLFLGCEALRKVWHC